MKIRTSINLIIITLFLSFPYSQIRYKQEVFNEVIKTEDVVYGNAPDIPFDGAFEWFTEDIDLTMDIYEGDGDTLTNRPVIIFMHSGGFLQAATKQMIWLHFLPHQQKWGMWQSV